MSSRLQLIATVVGLALIGVYSWIMIAAEGTAGWWAWIILLAGIVVLVTAARSAAAARSQRGGS